MKLNLKACDIIELRFLVTLTLSDDLIAQIKEASPPDEDGDSIFVDSYEVDGAKHRAWVWVSMVNEGTTKFRIDFNYELGKGGRLRKSTPRINKVVGILCSVEEEVDITCQVSFQFGRRRKAKPIIPLPLKLIELPNIPFDEIDGLHLVKRDGKQTKYDVILGVSSGGALTEIIFFDYHSRIREDLADEIIREAVRISNLFILKEE
jgi:hypothetical protein